ncbi:hypothetical protein E2C01_091365 [Portunus trituberculatus]|uniref:Uncharacterized protein n=1 Tax=Portunus trituberculatus TaxID=210409 RepID=A0A5B7JUT9_PORTR|nr:hypothetical protein [Portunus trituberculatus]
MCGAWLDGDQEREYGQLFKDKEKEEEEGEGERARERETEGHKGETAPSCRLYSKEVGGSGGSTDQLITDNEERVRNDGWRVSRGDERRRGGGGIMSSSLSAGDHYH